MKSRAGVLALAMLLSTSAAHAETFRCGRWVVSSDLAPAEIRAKCGEPDRIEVESNDVWVRTPAGGTVKRGVTTTERWIYDRGRRAAPMVVTIVEGRVKSLERAAKR